MSYDAQEEKNIQATAQMQRNHTASYIDQHDTRKDSRYQILAVADENCDSGVTGDKIAYFAALSHAKSFAWDSDAVARLPFGSAILDTVTGEYDFGFGFGVAAPEASENE